MCVHNAVILFRMENMTREQASKFTVHIDQSDKPIKTANKSNSEGGEGEKMGSSSTENPLKYTHMQIPKVKPNKLSEAAKRKKGPCLKYTTLIICCHTYHADYNNTIYMKKNLSVNP